MTKPVRMYEAQNGYVVVSPSFLVNLFGNSPTRFFYTNGHPGTRIPETKFVAVKSSAADGIDADGRITPLHNLKSSSDHYTLLDVCEKETDVKKVCENRALEKANELSKYYDCEIKRLTIEDLLKTMW